MKELFDRHQERLTDAEDRRVWSALHDETRRRRPAWRRFGLPISAAAALSTVAAVAVVWITVRPERTSDMLSSPAAQSVVDQDAPAMKSPARERAGRLDDRDANDEGAMNRELAADEPVEAKGLAADEVRRAKELAAAQSPRAELEYRRQAPRPAEVPILAEEAPAPSTPSAATEPSPAARKPLKAEVTSEGGVFRGRVTNLQGDALSYANVVILGTSMGAMTDTSGVFVVRNMPPGEYTAKVSYLGYEVQEVPFRVTESEGIAQNFELTEATVAALDVVKVQAARDMIGRESSSTAARLGSEELERLPVDTYEEAVGLKEGTVSQAGQLHFRGGRAGEEQYQVDDIPVTEPLAQSQPEGSADGDATRAERGKGDPTWGDVAKRSPASQVALGRPPSAARDNYGVPISVGGTDPVNGAEFDAMFFEHYGVNPFVDPQEDRFATFAVDVDNASYSLARSYLDRGALPPKEAIRVEEFVNSFDHDYPPPGSEMVATRDRGPSEHGTFAIHLEAAPSPFGKDLVLMRVGLKGREVEVWNRKPAVLTFVVDVSGSMQQENRLELVKRSLYLLLDRMNSEDEVGLVVYGSNARVILPSTSLRDRRQIERAIASLQPEGATNAEAGLREGYRLAERNYRKGWNNRVILCSDGVANVGQTGADDILREIKEQAGDGIYLTAVGFGMGNYNDVLMEKLADQGDGNYYYVDQIDEARKVFVENLTGTLQTIARQTKIQVEFEEDVVRRYRLLGYENRDVADRDFRNDAVDAGEVGAGHEVTALFEVKLERNARRGDLATVRIRYEDPDTKRVTEESRTLRVQDVKRSIDDADPSFRMDAAVAEFAEILRHSYWAKDGSLAAVSGMATEASRRMGNPEQLREMCRMVNAAWQLWPEQEAPTWNDDIRPAWEPEDDDR